MYSNLACVTFIFSPVYLYSFFFYSPRCRFCCKPKYGSNIIYHFIFVFFVYFPPHSSCLKDQFTVLNLKCGIPSDMGFPGRGRVSRLGEHISLVIWVSRLGEHISLVILVSQVGEQVSLVICVNSLGTDITRCVASQELF